MAIDDTYCPVYPDSPDFDKVADTVSAADYLADLDATLAALPSNRLTDYRKLFAQYDRETHHALLKAPFDASGAPVPPEINQLITDINLVSSKLRLRIQSRAHSPVDDLTPEPTITYDSTDGTVVRQLSTLQLAIIRGHLNAGSAIDYVRFEEAFELFANGQLRLHLPSGFWSTQPSSGFFFYFAEFAITAFDVLNEGSTRQDKSDCRDWRFLAPVLARSQSALAAVYRDQTVASPSLADYAAANYDSNRTLVPSELAALAVYCNSSTAGAWSDLNWLHKFVNENIHLMLPGESLTPLVTP